MARTARPYSFTLGSGFVGQLATLVRLESFDLGAFETVDLVELSASVVEQMAPWVYENHHFVELITAGAPVIIQGVPALLRDAIRNLLENAVRHTPASSHIIVRVGPGHIEVEDRQSSIVGTPFTSDKADSLEIGLKIIARIAEIHRGELRRSLSASGSDFTIVV